MIKDKNWKVRAQLCYNLGAFQWNHKEIVLALICALADQDPEVKEAAQSSLYSLGYNSRGKMMRAMIQVGLISDTMASSDSSRLDVIYTN